MITAYRDTAYILSGQGAKVLKSSRRPRVGRPTPLIVGAVSKAPHPEAAKLFVELGDVEAWPGLVSNQPDSIRLGRTDAPPMPPVSAG